MRHRDHDRIVTVRDRASRKAVALGPQHDGQLLAGAQRGRVQAQRVLPQRHGRRAEAQGAERLRPALPRREVRPGQLKDRAHAHADRAAVERVAALVGEQHRVHPQRRSRAENRADVRRVHHVLEHGDSSRAAAYLFYRRQRGPPHRAEHPAREVKARQRAQHLLRRGIDRDAGAAGDERRALAGDVLCLHEKGDRLAAAVERPLDDDGTLGDEKPLGRVAAADKLVFRETGIDVQLRGGKILDFNDRGHGVLPVLYQIRLFYRSGRVRARAPLPLFIIQRQRGQLQASLRRVQSDSPDSAALTGKTIDGAVFGE